MDDYRVNSGWSTHPKRKKLQRRLGPDGALAIMDLWGFCARDRTDGRLNGMDNEDIAIAADYDGDADKLVGTLVELRLLDDVDGEHRIHNWEQRQPYNAGHAARSFAGKVGAHAKWAKRNGCPGGGEHCGEHCGRSKSNAIRGNSNAVRKDSNAVRKQEQCDSSKPHSPVSPPSPSRNPPTSGTNPKDTSSSPTEPDQLVLEPVEVVPKTDRTADDIAAVWSSYRDHHPKAPNVLRPDDKRYKLVKDRLKSYSVNDLAGAVAGYHKSPWHQGANDTGTKYLGLDLIMRDDGHVQKGLEMAESPTLGRTSALEMRNAMHLKSFINNAEEKEREKNEQD